MMYISSPFLIIGSDHTAADYELGWHTTLGSIGRYSVTSSLSLIVRTGGSARSGIYKTKIAAINRSFP